MLTHACFCTGACKTTGSCSGYSTTGTATFMSTQRVGTCSLCGGDVVGHRGAWMGINPPSPDRCSSCGAVRAADVIPMARPGLHPPDGLPDMSEDFRRTFGLD